jgi:polysaccharide deacetylase family protein (PEP-CTERM system associated)
MMGLAEACWQKIVSMMQGLLNTKPSTNTRFIQEENVCGIAMNKPVINPPSIIITVDVEDWFQVENFKGIIHYDSWPIREIRVERNTHLILDMLDSGYTGVSSNKSKPKATFFVLGWIAERLPQLVREIAGRGHEVASHGLMHNLCSNMSEQEIFSDLSASKKTIEDIIGSRVWGYRAPSFDVNQNSLHIIETCGYLYDSSYNSYSGHGRYGHVDLAPYDTYGIAVKISDSFYELPISNLSIKGKIIPWGGGGYFRLTPFPVFHMGVQTIINNDNAYLFYTHPWEFDPKQPRVNGVPAFFKFRHYVNLNNNKDKFLNFIDKFNNVEFITCKSYLDRLI